jgi:hypothetical protein
MPRRYAVKRITERDRQILQWTGRHGLASDEQLARRFWSGKRVSTARDRLAQLAKAGYLEQHACDARKPGERVYSLTRQGRLLFTGAERERLQVGLPAPGEIKQQLLAQEAYMRLEDQVAEEGHRLAYWRSERELRGEFRRAQQSAEQEHKEAPDWEIADAQAVITDGNGEVVEEVDVEIDGQYYGKMLRAKAARFGRGGRPTVWVCEPHRAKIVQGAIRPYANIRILVVGY